MSLMTILNGGKTPVTFIGTDGESVVPSDSITFAPSAIYVGTGGNLAVMFAGGESPVIFNNVAEGSFLPINVIAVYATNTTAENIVRIF